MVSISVLIITYNQQDLIGRALDSILRQKEWGLKEIVVCDDCSTDKNWEVLQTYVHLYPDIIRAYRNVPNLGMYRNVEKTYSLKGDADLFVTLAGDDEICDGYFQKVQELIDYYHIDANKDCASICFDFCVKRPSGNTIIVRTNKSLKNAPNPYRLKFRGYVHCRGMVMTKNVLDKYQNVADGKTVTLAESLSEIQAFANSKKIYYCPFVANVYYSQIGVSTTMRDSTHYKNDEAKWDYMLSHWDLCPKDINYALMRKSILSYAYAPKLSTLFNIVKYYFLSRDSQMPFAPINYIVNIRLIIKSTFKH